MKIKSVEQDNRVIITMSDEEALALLNKLAQVWDHRQKIQAAAAVINPVAESLMRTMSDTVSVERATVNNTPGIIAFSIAGE